MSRPLPGDHAEELSGEDLEQWQRVQARIAALAQSTLSGADDDFYDESPVPQINLDKVLNAIHVPKDAAEYRDNLKLILRRVPAGWGRWMSCGPGWYSLIVDLDRQLAAIDPDYQVYQIKGKFGSLHYYCSLAEAELPGQLIASAEEYSRHTCETCGKAATLCQSTAGWYSTLCPDHAPQMGFVAQPNSTED